VDLIAATRHAAETAWSATEGQQMTMTATELEDLFRTAYQRIEEIINDTGAFADTMPDKREAFAWFIAERAKYSRYLDIISRALTNLPDDTDAAAAVLADMRILLHGLMLADFKRDYRRN
jgi:hypothetical protein